MDDALQINNQNTNQVNAELAQVTMPEIDDAEYFMASPYFAGFEDLESPESFAFIDSFVDLPVALKSFLSSPKTAGAIYSLAIENDLGEIEASTIASLIRDVAVGNVFVKDFPALLASRLGIDAARASAIANKIASDLFAPVIEAIKIIQKQKFADKIRLMQLESGPKVDEKSFIESQYKTPTEPFRPAPAKPVVPLPQRPLAAPLPRQVQPGPQPLRQALPPLSKPQPATQLPPISTIPKLAPRPIAPPPPQTPPPNLPRPEVKTEESNILDLRNKK